MVGDLIASAFSLWLVREARALGAPWHVTARMLANVALEGTVEIIPVAGDAFDVLFRANIRNMRLLRHWMERQPRKNYCGVGSWCCRCWPVPLQGARGRRGSGKSWLS